MNKILSELMKDSKLQEVNLVEKKKIKMIPHLETWQRNCRIQRQIPKSY